MKKVKVSMTSTAVFFAVVASLALFVWHSWYLYYGAVLIGYVALTLLTVILEHGFHFKRFYPDQFIRDKGRFYNVISNRYVLFCLINYLILAFFRDSTDLCVLFVVLHLMTLLGFIVIALYCCEGGDWRFWYLKALFG